MHDVYYAIDVETSFIYFKTTTQIASGDKSVVWYNDGDGQNAGGMGIYFKPATMVIFFSIHACSMHAPLPRQPSLQTTRVWMIKKRGFETELWCNEELLLNFTVSSETCEKDKDWEIVYSREVKSVRFPGSHDTATQAFDTG